MNNSLDISAARHSLAHVMAAAVQRLYGAGVKFGVGPAIENGFYYDMDFDDAGVEIGDDDLAKIEAEMHKIIKEDQKFVCSTKTIAEAEQWAKKAGQPFKLELIEDYKHNGTTSVKAKAKQHDADVETDGDTMTFYTNGDFTDLCRGGHVASTGELKNIGFKLTRIAGAYFRGDETKPMMTRIYGGAFQSQKELDDHLKLQEEAKERDHRKLGKELDLYVTSDLVGAGLPMFTPRGTVLRQEIAAVSCEYRADIGFQAVWTPHMTKPDLYVKSGHWAKFGDQLFRVHSNESGDDFVLKPMNCPHHTRIFASRVRSYRDMPQRYMEVTTDYRDEKSGELGGLSRVRSLTQDDSHDFCRPDQIESEIAGLLNCVQKIYALFDMKLRVRLSYRDDSDHYLGSPELWASAQKQLKDAVIKMGNLEYYEQEGEAAFYGPKIDFMATDALGREHQLATAQLDFVQPERFELEYIDADGKPQRPVMIHCALLGSLERFLSVYIEHTAGKFPVWVAPEQLRIVKVKDDCGVDKMVNELAAAAKAHKVRFTVDDGNGSISKKIRSAVAYKVPYVVVVGDKEAESGQVAVRVRGDLVDSSRDGAVDDKGNTTAKYTPTDLAVAIQREHDSRSKLSTL